MHGSTQWLPTAMAHLSALHMSSKPCTHGARYLVIDAAGLHTIDVYARPVEGRNACKWLRESSRTPARVQSLPGNRSLLLHMSKGQADRLVSLSGGVLDHNGIVHVPGWQGVQNVQSVQHMCSVLSSRAVFTCTEAPTSRFTQCVATCIPGDALLPCCRCSCMAGLGVKREW
jgi:hypothetical protein